MKRILAIASMAALTGLVSAAETCGLTEINPGWSHQHLDINDAGVVINSVSGDDGYDGGVLLLQRGADVASWLPDLGGEYTFAYAINNSGIVAGFAEDVNGTESSGDVDRRSSTQLPLLPRSQPSWGGGEAQGLNDHRGVVGFSYAADGKRHAVLWVGRKANDLNRILGSVSSAAYAINNKGQIIGSADFSDSDAKAFLYQGGTVQFFGTIDGDQVFSS